MGCITSKTVITENPNRFDVIFADTEQTVYYNAQLEINGKFAKVLEFHELAQKLQNYNSRKRHYLVPKEQTPSLVATWVSSEIWIWR